MRVIADVSLGSFMVRNGTEARDDQTSQSDDSSLHINSIKSRFNVHLRADSCIIPQCEALSVES